MYSFLIHFILNSSLVGGRIMENTAVRIPFFLFFFSFSLSCKWRMTQLCHHMFWLKLWHIFILNKGNLGQNNRMFSVVEPLWCRAGTGIREAEPRLEWEPFSVRTALKWKICLGLSLPRALQGNSGRLRGVSHLMMCTAASALICRPQTAWKLHSVLSFISYQYDICPERGIGWCVWMRAALYLPSTRETQARSHNTRQ